MFDLDRRHLIAYLAAAAVLVVIAARSVGRGNGSDPAPGISMAAPAPSRSATRARPRGQPRIWIDVAGAVRRPGLYALPAGARVAAALEQAGGVRGRADRAAVNLAAKLTDGQQIFVPVRGPGGARAIGAGGSAGGASASGAGASAGGAVAGAGSGARISLSNATQEQLETLDGIGPALAQRIIQYREQQGGFKSIDELQEVSGIGEKRFQALKDSVAP